LASVTNAQTAFAVVHGPESAIGGTCVAAYAHAASASSVKKCAARRSWEMRLVPVAVIEATRHCLPRESGDPCCRDTRRSALARLRRRISPRFRGNDSDV